MFHLSQVLPILRWLGKWYLATDLVRVEQFKPLVDIINHRIQTRGALDVIFWLKAIRVHVIRFIAGNPLLERQHPHVILVHGLPLVIPKVIRERVINGDVNTIRMLMTVLNLSKTLPGTVAPDYSSITDPSKQTKEFSKVCHQVGTTQNMLGWKINFEGFSSLHLTSKSGPNGQALVSSMSDLTLVSSGHLQSLNTIGGAPFERMWESLQRLTKYPALLNALSKRYSYKTGEFACLRKGSIIKDKEGKARLIGILDYWSQTVLRPLHDSLMLLLKGVKGDCTYNQESHRRWLPSNGPYFSYDLKSATDRLPVNLQKEVLGRFIGEDKAAAWQDLMVGIPFVWPDGVTRKYSVGQPMGGYSSWAMLAVTHHLIVRTAARLEGYPSSWCKYALLGDDLVLTDEKVANRYLSLMSALGVEISWSKSLVSKDTYEFAKRIICRGHDVSGAPLDDLLADKFYLLNEAVSQLELRWATSCMVTRGLFSSLYESRGFRKGLSVRLGFKAWRCWLVPMERDSPAIEAEKLSVLYTYFKTLYPPLPCTYSVDWFRNWSHAAWAEVKVGQIEESLKATQSSYVKFVNGLNGFIKENYLYLQGDVDSQSLLLSLPMIQVARENLRDLQSDFDRLRHCHENCLDLDIIWNKVVRSGFDPSAVMNKRANQLILSQNAGLANKLGFLFQGMAKAREWAYCADSTTPV